MAEQVEVVALRVLLKKYNCFVSNFVSYEDLRTTVISSYLIREFAELVANLFRVLPIIRTTKYIVNV